MDDLMYVTRPFREDGGYVSGNEHESRCAEDWTDECDITGAFLDHHVQS